LSGVKFPPGLVVATPGVLAALAAAGDDPLAYLVRHVAGDWGEVDAEDWQANEQSLLRELRLLSVYSMSNGTKFWIISEADRSSTCILLPDEY
jgi:hypothetical protein